MKVNTSFSNCSRQKSSITETVQFWWVSKDVESSEPVASGSCRQSIPAICISLSSQSSTHCSFATGSQVLAQLCSNRGQHSTLPKILVWLQIFSPFGRLLYFLDINGTSECKIMTCIISISCTQCRKGAELSVGESPGINHEYAHAHPSSVSLNRDQRKQCRSAYLSLNLFTTLPGNALE